MLKSSVCGWLYERVKIERSSAKKKKWHSLISWIENYTEKTKNSAKEAVQRNNAELQQVEEELKKACISMP